MATKPVAGKTTSGAAAGVLGKLASLGSVKPKAKATSTKWELPLTPEAEADALRWVGGKAVLEPVEKRVEQGRNEFGEYALSVMAERLFANKSKPSNPLVILKKEDGKTHDHQFQFSLQDRFKKFDLPEGDVDLREHFVNALSAVGLRPADAEKLVDNELDFSPVPEVKSPKELLEGHFGEKREWIEATDDQKSAGNKLVAFLVWDGTGDAPEPLTPEEQVLVIESRNGVTVRGGFYDRVATYCQNKEQLLGVFKVVKPIFSLGFLKFALNDTETDKTRRKIEAAADILGTATTSEEE
jgi:hypothetical protein